MPPASEASLAGAGVWPLARDVPFAEDAAAASAARRSGVNGAAGAPEGLAVPIASAVFPWSWFAAAGAGVDGAGADNIDASATASADIAAPLGAAWLEGDEDFDAGGSVWSEDVVGSVDEDAASWSSEPVAFATGDPDDAVAAEPAGVVADGELGEFDGDVVAVEVD